MRSHCIIGIHIALYLRVNVNFDYEVDERSGFAMESARNCSLAYKHGLLWEIVALLGRSEDLPKFRGVLHFPVAFRLLFSFVIEILVDCTLPEDTDS